MTIPEIDTLCIKKINILYEDLMLLYNQKIKELGFIVGDYVYKYKHDDVIIEEGTKKLWPFKVLEIYVENNNSENYISLPKIIIKANKCFTDKRPTKSFYNLEGENYKLFTENIQVKKQPALKATYVYFIEAGDIFKIGFSNNPEKRLYQIQTSNPHVCKILFKIKDPFGSLEKDLHSKFNSFRLQGEWFKKSDLILKEFELLNSNEHHFLDSRQTLFPII